MAAQTTHPRYSPDVGSGNISYRCVTGARIGAELGKPDGDDRRESVDRRRRSPTCGGCCSSTWAGMATRWPQRPTARAMRAEFERERARCRACSTSGCPARTASRSRATCASGYDVGIIMVTGRRASGRPRRRARDGRRRLRRQAFRSARTARPRSRACCDACSAKTTAQATCAGLGASSSAHRPLHARPRGASAARPRRRRRSR